MDVLTACHQALVADLWAAVVSAAPAPAAVVAKAYGDFTPLHRICSCTPTHTFCGIVRNNPADIEDNPDGPRCDVCVDLDLLPCPRCGL